MTRSRRQFVVLYVAAILALIGEAGATAQSSLAAARDLYSAAAYEDALQLLNRIRGSELRAGDDGYIVEQYRAFCLLALGRKAEAESAIESLVRSAPSFRPSDADVAPHVRDAFREVRRRTLPAVIEATYQVAKAAFDRKDPGAADAFKLVLDLSADSDLGALRNQPPVSELRTLAAGFLALATAPAPAPPPAQQPPTAAPPQAAAASERRAAITTAPSMVVPPRPTSNRIYGPDDANVVPPVVVRQSFAPLNDVFALRQGIVEVLVDETGEVIAAKTVLSVNAVYDRIALATARSWRYRPAMLDGIPVKFRAIVQLQQKPR